jgi:hypothetical protein
MKRLFLAALAIAALMSGAGCGTSAPKATSETSKPTLPTSSLLISWTSDGNPLVPVCGTTMQNCKLNITVLDKTTGTTVSLPITATSYSAPNSNDTYEVRVYGFDGQGNSISSTFEQVPVD